MISLPYDVGVKIPPDLAETLAAVVDEGTMDGAAAVLGISQPAVSQRIRALESLTGQVMLVRSRPVSATAAGDIVIRYARQLAHLERDAVTALGIDSGPTRASLPIAVNSDSLSTWMLPALVELADRLPVVFDLQRDDQDFTMRLLEDGVVVAAVASRAEPITGCRVIPLGSMRYTPVATVAFHERYFPDGVTDEALAHAPLVDFDRRDDLQTRWLVARGVDPSLPPRNRVPASSDFADAVLMGLGWGQLLPFQMDEALAAGRLKRLDNTHVDVPLFWQQWNMRSDLLDEVAATVVRHAGRALDQR